MSVSTGFASRLERKVREQLRGQRVGYLLGAGSSYLEGKGYPLASQLWDQVAERVKDEERQAIQSKLDEGAEGLEHALDLLDPGSVDGSPHRHSVAKAISEHFATLRPPLDVHADFVARLAQRNDFEIPIFCLNYDPLLERAATLRKVRFVDGFLGVEDAYFDPAAFQERIGVPYRTQRHSLSRFVRGTIHLFKLHGSLGWYESATEGIRRFPFSSEIPVGTKRLMVPPQYRKAAETLMQPYDTLWSEFHRYVRHGPLLVHRLACIGYGMRDGHVNAVIEAGLARPDLTVLILAKELDDAVFDRWASKERVIVVTENACSLGGEMGPGHPDLWRFEWLSKEV